MQAKCKEELQRIAGAIRYGAVRAVHAAGAGHPGGSLSAADLLAYLYFEKMNIDPADPKWDERDRFVLSKGHASPGLYAALAERGYFSPDLLDGFRQVESVLQGHPDMKQGSFRGSPTVSMR